MIPVFSFILSNVFKVATDMTDQILTIKEVAAYLKLAEKTAYKLAAEGKLPGFRGPVEEPPRVSILNSLFNFA
ncbi:MAG: helix-turn-helix domain-containing protein [Flavobacteriales bacterium]|nr:helix-turn-helix domain-containing protein [Flavobacteriales bacterium]